ncbi:MAG TPA: DinB family protein [Gemmatimonadales bacterium]
MTALADLPALVLGPLEGRPDSAWQRAPAGKWTPAQIVEHLALAVETSAATFAARRAKPSMTRRATTLREKAGKVFAFGFGWFPPGRKAPEATTPAAHVDGPAAATHFRSALAAWEAVARELLPARRRDLFVKHPRLGDLTIGEWARFHLIHARHHARQIRQRVAG